jgi:hypothetical protein
MQKKTALQLIIISLLIIVFLIFFFKYFRDDSIVNNNSSRKEIIELNKNLSSNYINDINYITLDADGNKYQITAEVGEVDMNNSEIMFLTKVIAYIHLKDSESIKITSNFGKYNIINFDTIFSKNVIMNYINHKITGDYFDFSYQNNLGTMSTNVFYSSNKTKLKADRIEMNITSKDTRIFMNDNIKKVEIIEIR